MNDGVEREGPIRRQRFDPPLLILVMGVPASGKTTLARALLAHVAAVYLDNNFLADAFYPNTRTEAKYRTIRDRLYDALYRITKENLEVGNSVLLDVPHVTHVRDPKWRTFIRELATDAGGRVVVIRTLCSEQTLRERLEMRGAKRDEWKLQNWSEFMRREPIEVPIPFEHLDVDTEQSPEHCARIALQHVLVQREGRV